MTLSSLVRATTYVRLRDHTAWNIPMLIRKEDAQSLDCMTVARSAQSQIKTLWCAGNKQPETFGARQPSVYALLEREHAGQARTG
jgi:hypothetical protein